MPAVRPRPLGKCLALSSANGSPLNARERALGVTGRNGVGASVVGEDPWLVQKKMATQPGFLGCGIATCVSCRCAAVIRCDRRCLSDRSGKSTSVLRAGGLDAVGLSWTSWDMIEKVRRADQGFRGITDAGRTERGFHAVGNEESAGGWLFRWVGIGSL